MGLNRRTVFLRRFFSVCAMVCLLLHSSFASAASDRQDIRFYRVNKDMISERFWFTRGKAKQAGCHNTLKRTRLYRVVQFDYQVCRVFSQSDCQPDSIVSFKREKKNETVTDLSEGYSWFPISDHQRGMKIKSWFCEEKP